MNKSESIKELAAALSKAQAEIAGAVKNSENPHFRSKFADLESVWDVIREPLSKNGLAVTQATEIVDEKLNLVTTLMHSSGEWISGIYPIRPTKADPQGLGGGMTYGRRYALCAMVGVYQVDDDGEAAQGRTPGKPVTRDAPKLVSSTHVAEQGAPAEYVFEFGQYKGQSIVSVERAKLASYLDYLSKGASREPSRVTGSVRAAIEAMKKYLGSDDAVNIGSAGDFSF